MDANKREWEYKGARAKQSDEELMSIQKNRERLFRPCKK